MVMRSRRLCAGGVLILNRRVLLAVVFVCWAAFGCATGDVTDGPPSTRPGLVFVPGIAGSGLYAEFKQATLPACSASPVTLPMTRLWAAIWQALPPLHRQQCLLDKMSLQYSRRCKTNWFGSRNNLSLQLKQIGEQGVLELEQPNAAARGFLGWEPDTSAATAAEVEGQAEGLRPFEKIVLRRLAATAKSSTADNSWFTGCEWVYHTPEGAFFSVDAGLRGIDYLDYFRGVGVYGTKYFHDFIIKAKNEGFGIDDMIAFPYDWRLPYWQVDIGPLKTAIEDWVVRHPGRRMTIVAHSLGCVVVNHFLNKHVTREWKEKHVESFVAIAGAFGGSLKAIRSLLSGYDGATSFDLFGLFNVTFIPPLLLREGYRTFGSMYALVANPLVYDETATVITVTSEEPTPSSRAAWRAAATAVAVNVNRKLERGATDEELDFGQQTVHSLHNRWQRQDRGQFAGFVSRLSARSGFVEFFVKLWEQIVRFVHWLCFWRRTAKPGQYTLMNWWRLLPVQLQRRAKQALHRQLEDADSLLGDPEVPVFCLWGRFTVPTTEVAYRYVSRNVDIAPQYVLGFGDGTVTVKSASVCAGWDSTVLYRQFDNVEHMHMVQEEQVIDFVLSLLNR